MKNETCPTASFRRGCMQFSLFYQLSCLQRGLRYLHNHGLSSTALRYQKPVVIHISLLSEFLRLYIQTLFNFNEYPNINKYLLISFFPFFFMASKAFQSCFFFFGDTYSMCLAPIIFHIIKIIFTFSFN